MNKRKLVNITQPLLADEYKISSSDEQGFHDG